MEAVSGWLYKPTAVSGSTGPRSVNASHIQNGFALRPDGVFDKCFYAAGLFHNEAI